MRPRRGIDVTLQKLLRKVADENNLKYSEVEAIYLSQYKTLQKSIMAGEIGDPASFKFVELPFLGKFVVKIGRVKYFHDSPEETDIYPTLKTNPYVPRKE